MCRVDGVLRLLDRLGRAVAGLPAVDQAAGAGDHRPHAGGRRLGDQGLARALLVLKLGLARLANDLAALRSEAERAADGGRFG